MMITEAIVEALKLMIEIVQIAWTEHQKREQEITDNKAKQAAFEAVVTQALDLRRTAWQTENAQVQSADDAADQEIDRTMKQK